MSHFEKPSLIESGIKTSLVKTLTREEIYTDFGQSFKGGIQLKDDEGFLLVYLKNKMHLGQFQDIINVLKTVENASNPVYIKLWDEAHYRQYLFKHGGTLTSVHKFRIRHRNPPPPGICPGGARPKCRLTRSSVGVLRKWFNAHSEDPYPCRKAKLMLAERAGIPVSKVTTWFSNARRKHKKELQRLNELDKANGTTNGKYHHKLVPVHVSVDTKELEMLKNKGNAKCSKVVDDSSLDPSNIVASEMANEILVIKTSSDNENEWNFPMSSFDKSETVQIDNKQKDRKTIKYSDCLMPCQKLPFSEVNIRDNTETEKSSSESILHYYNYYKKDQNQMKRNTQNLKCKQFLHSNRVDHYIQSRAGPDCKKQTTNKRSAIYNKEGNKTNAKSVFGYRQIQQRLKFGKRNLKKTKDFNLVSKLRARLEENIIKGDQPEKGASSSDRTAINCLNSLQEMCQHLENKVISPVDYAYGVEFDGLDSEGMTEECNVTNAAESGYSLAYDYTSDCKIDNCTKSGPQSIYEKINDWSGTILPLLSQHKPTWNDDEETFQNPFIGTEVENSILGSPRKSSLRDQVVQRPLNVYNSLMFSAGGVQHYRSPGTDWENMWTLWCSHPSQDVMKGSQIDTSTLEDYHYLGSYSTVVGEAIQGLLNLSSTQESGFNSLQGQHPNAVFHSLE